MIHARHCVSGPMAPTNKPFVWIKGTELIQSYLSVCRPNQLQENPMIYRRTSIFSYRFGFMNIQKWFWAWVVVLFSHSSSPSSSSFLSHDDIFLFYRRWCRTSTMQSSWIAMKIPWTIIPKVQKFLYFQKRLDEYHRRTRRGFRGLRGAPCRTWNQWVFGGILRPSRGSLKPSEAPLSPQRLLEALRGSLKPS